MRARQSKKPKRVGTGRGESKKRTAARTLVPSVVECTSSPSALSSFFSPTGGGLPAGALLSEALISCSVLLLLLLLLF
jgi:hypothetical protein